MVPAALYANSLLRVCFGCSSSVAPAFRPLTPSFCVPCISSVHLQAQANSFQMLMPLALPAPDAAAAGYGGVPAPGYGGAPAAGFTGQPGYGGY